MRRALALAALLLGGCNLLSVKPVAAPVAAEVQGDVAVVTALKHTVNMTEGCTAVDIGLGRVLTAKHCVDDLKLGDKTSVGMLTYVSPDRDFALLANQEWVKHPAPSMRPPRLGEHLYSVGFPGQLAEEGRPLAVVDGVVSGPVDSEGMLRITAPIYGGNSGGGAWAEDGSLIGITVASYVFRGAAPALPYPGQALMISVEDVLAALK